MEIVRKYARIILVIYKDEDDASIPLEQTIPKGQINIEEEDIEKWKKAISLLNVS